MDTTKSQLLDALKLTGDKPEDLVCFYQAPVGKAPPMVSGRVLRPHPVRLRRPPRARDNRVVGRGALHRVQRAIRLRARGVRG